jgi:hypothetical protein
MISFNLMLDLMKILLMTYLISYTILFVITWYSKIKNVLLPGKK